MPLTAIGCEPGDKPDNICHCVQGALVCDGHLRNCLPFGSETYAPTAEGRPMPRHRATAVTCESPANVSRAATCSPQQQAPSGPGLDCAVSSDCESEEACLQQHFFGGASTCRCLAADCLRDTDCRESEVCNCGANDPSVHCDGPYYNTPCTNRCIPALCKTDADCPGGWCSPSPNECSSGVAQWACHFEVRDECLTDAECRYSGAGSTCRHNDDGWHCTSGPICD